MVDPREFSLASTEDISEVDIVDSGLCTSRINPESILNRGIQVAGGLQNQYEQSVSALLPLKETEGPGRTRVPTTQ